ncbi:DsbA family protein [Desulfobotulus mexicanus]|uniref:Thioredoxin domain-containing protein n=1 Tax=Desulfobotulus mexicanus TaxID=2586642 RepID=A0A5Q4VHE2_9BACT|nr:thioredoxin domain-containing protein [Desulfobotulus mexicanus]TYT76338.1 thioredoxin domain-containing protein [Desulfobotulus mexicanus]
MKVFSRGLFFVLIFCVSLFPFLAFGGVPSEEIVSLNVENLKKSIAQRTVLSWGQKDERFQSFGPDQVRVDQQIPIKFKDSVLFAVKVALILPPPENKEEVLLLVVDAGGQMQFTDIQDLASGRSLFEEPMSVLRRIEKLPADFGKQLFQGSGMNELVVVSDPFCPYCRQGWAFLKGQREKMKSLRLVHFPLNRISELVCMALADAEARDFKVLEMTDFVYGELHYIQDPKAIVNQFMKAFPELKKNWGEDADSALNYLESKYADKVRKERMDAQALGIQSTPIFFVNGYMVEGFRADKLGELLK